MDTCELTAQLKNEKITNNSHLSMSYHLAYP